ncbi:MAG: transglycosylase domain-containing protein [Nitrospirota bacterium]
MRILKKYIFIGLGIAAFIVLLIGIWVFSILSNLPDITYLKHYRPAAAADVLDRNGNHLVSYYDGTFRIWVPIASLPERVIHAVIIAEDDTFFGHKGINYKAAWNAFKHDVQKRKFARGGSTITQQMIKNVVLSREKTITRKLREYVLAQKAEDLLTKRQILQIYLNEVEWGEHIYGIEAASRFYFDKHATELTAAEAALLAGMLPNPRYYNPYKRINKARDRQERVLFNMHQAKLLTAEDYTAALAAPLILRHQNGGTLYVPSASLSRNRACYQQALEQALLGILGEYPLYRGGNTIKTTLDKSLQEDIDRLGNRSETGATNEILVVKEGDQIRAFVCGMGNEQAVGTLLDSRGLHDHPYTLSRISSASISREQILMRGQEKSD